MRFGDTIYYNGIPFAEDILIREVRNDREILTTLIEGYETSIIYDGHIDGIYVVLTIVISVSRIRIWLSIL